MSTKKVAAKAASKKTSAPKKHTAKHAKRVLARAEGPQCFWVHNGEILADLVEFERALASMALDTFTHHVSESRNDFADWIEFVLGDTELAAALRGATKPRQARTIVVRRLKIYDLP